MRLYRDCIRAIPWESRNWWRIRSSPGESRGPAPERGEAAALPAGYLGAPHPHPALGRRSSPQLVPAPGYFRPQPSPLLVPHPHQCGASALGGWGVVHGPAERQVSLPPLPAAGEPAWPWPGAHHGAPPARGSGTSAACPPARSPEVSVLQRRRSWKALPARKRRQGPRAATIRWRLCHLCRRVLSRPQALRGQRPCSSASACD